MAWCVGSMGSFNIERRLEFKVERLYPKRWTIYDCIVTSSTKCQHVKKEAATYSIKTTLSIKDPTQDPGAMYIQKSAQEKWKGIWQTKHV